MIFEPQNDFYNRHKNECSLLERRFYINGEDGYAVLMAAPDSNREVDVLRNGTIVFIRYAYDHRGESWGVAEYKSPNSGKNVTGWFPLSQLVRVYDHFSFEEEHSGEFYHYAGNLEGLRELDSLVVWEWPGADSTPWSVSSGTLHLDPVNFISPSMTYKDDQGREWCYFDYKYESMHKWICVSDPSNDEIAAFTPAPNLNLRTPAETLPSLRGQTSLALVIILVVVVVVAAAVLIYVFWRRNQDPNASTRIRRYSKNQR